MSGELVGTAVDTCFWRLRSTVHENTEMEMAYSYFTVQSVKKAFGFQECPVDLFPSVGILELRIVCASFGVRLPFS